MHFVFLILLGLSINGYNASEAGRPVESLDDLKTAIEMTVDDVKSRDHFVSHPLND